MGGFRNGVTGVLLRLVGKFRAFQLAEQLGRKVTKGANDIGKYSVDKKESNFINH